MATPRHKIIKGFAHVALVVVLFCVLSGVARAESWGTVKKHVYARDAGTPTFYCGCAWADKKVDHASCGYAPRASLSRSLRTEVEHICPASWIADRMQLRGAEGDCWARGGRERCAQEHPIYKEAIHDLRNLVVAVGEVNGDRSARPFGYVEGEERVYGACDFEIATQAAEPRPGARRHIAQTYVYMSVRYNLPLTEAEYRLFGFWLRESRE